jgi:hypothetical protein
LINLKAPCSPMSRVQSQIEAGAFFIHTRITTINGVGLFLYKDGDGDIGQQMPAVIGGRQFGRMDILTTDAENNFVEIELKKGKEADQVIGQLLRYMGWVDEFLCKDKQTVRGLIICKEVDERLRLAAKMVSDRISVVRYKADFYLLDKL